MKTGDKKVLRLTQGDVIFLKFDTSLDAFAIRHYADSVSHMGVKCVMLCDGVDIVAIQKATINVAKEAA